MATISPKPPKKLSFLRFPIQLKLTILEKVDPETKLKLTKVNKVLRSHSLVNGPFEKRLDYLELTFRLDPNHEVHAKPLEIEMKVKDFEFKYIFHQLPPRALFAKITYCKDLKFESIRKTRTQVTDPIEVKKLAECFLNLRTVAILWMGMPDLSTYQKFLEHTSFRVIEQGRICMTESSTEFKTHFIQTKFNTCPRLLVTLNRQPLSIKPFLELAALNHLKFFLPMETLEERLQGIISTRFPKTNSNFVVILEASNLLANEDFNRISEFMRNQLEKGVSVSDPLESIFNRHIFLMAGETIVTTASFRQKIDDHGNLLYFMTLVHQEPKNDCYGFRQFMDEVRLFVKYQAVQP